MPLRDDPKAMREYMRERNERRLILYCNSAEIKKRIAAVAFHEHLDATSFLESRFLPGIMEEVAKLEKRHGLDPKKPVLPKERRR